MLLRAICALVLLGTLAVGLWPFHRPRNEVSWLSNDNGLSFGKYGSIVSAAPFMARSSQTDGSCSIEMWLQARKVKASGTILAFYWPGSRAIPFALRQSLGDLVLLRRNDDASRHGKRIRLYVDDVFSHPQPAFVTISSGPSGTKIYVDGGLVKTAPNFRFSSRELTGQLVIGNAPATTDNWSGQLKGLAVYDRGLTADDVSQHYENWKTGWQATLAGSEGAVGLYLFNEGNGSVVHNQVDRATDLHIPERFFVLQEQFLERPWDEFRPDWNYWKDVSINVGGFVPLGFFFYGYFSLLRRAEHPAAGTIVLGFAVSLTIEVLQAFLPTRDSGMTDLITNTLGTIVGVVVCKNRAIHAVLTQAALSTE
ncbi:MAG: VanZ family protein [Candidatus Sulfotelmatobacter sp.]